MIESMAARLLRVLPTRLISRAVGRLARIEFPQPVQTALNRRFARLAGVDIEEARREPGDYESLQAFFTRRLREGVRPVESGDRAVVSPVDGRFGACGRIHEGTLVQAKGRRYGLSELLDSPEDAAIFEGGSYTTIYLSPGHYHRIHSPVDAGVDALSYIPGRLLPVNRIGLHHVDRLFAINERLTAFLSTDAGLRVGVVMVGATCVGRIGVTCHGIEGNRWFARRRFLRFDDGPALSAGDELGVFNLGSTVVVLVEPPGLTFDRRVEEGAEVRMGERLGRADSDRG